MKTSQQIWSTASRLKQIETKEGLDNVEEIAELDAVDCLWVGHFDLTNFLGIPGDFNSDI